MSIRSENISKIPIDDVIARLMEATNSKNLSQLAEALDTKQGVVSNWRRRGTIPWNLIFENFSREAAIYIVFGINASKKLHNEIDDSEPKGQEPRASQTEAHAQQAAPDVEALRRQIARLEGALDHCRETNAALLAQLGELAKADGTPSRETATH